MNLLLIAACSLSLIHSSALYANDKPLNFFLNYNQLWDEFNPNVIQLYSDQALIHTVRLYPLGIKKSMSLIGLQWKPLILKTLPLAKEKMIEVLFQTLRLLT